MKRVWVIRISTAVIMLLNLGFALVVGLLLSSLATKKVLAISKTEKRRCCSCKNLTNHDIIKTGFDHVETVIRCQKCNQ